MKQRIKLAQALVHDPDLLFLDEPTNGMDPKGRDEMLDLVRDLARNKGVNVIVSSHLLPDVEYTCDHVVVLDKGKIAASGTIDALKGPAGRVFEVRVKGDAAAFAARLQGRGHRVSRDATTSCACSCRATRPAPGPTSSGSAAWPIEAGVQVRHLRRSLPTLEDVFARAIGER